jgi:hypothetical protein
MDIIWVRLVILKKLCYARLYGRWCSGNLAANVDHLHVKRIHLVDFIYIVLEDADDTILFMYHNLDHVTIMKLLLSMFEHLSGLKINFHKSENFVLGKQKNMEYNMHKFLGVTSIQVSRNSYAW